MVLGSEVLVLVLVLKFRVLVLVLVLRPRVLVLVLTKKSYLHHCWIIYRRIIAQRCLTVDR